MRCAGSTLRRRVLQSDKNLDPEPSCSVCPKENQAPAPRGASARKLWFAISSRPRVTRARPSDPVSAIYFPNAFDPSGHMGYKSYPVTSFFTL